MSFKAKYRGSCEQCDDPIVPNQDVEYDFVGNLMHVICPESIDQRTGKPLQVCPICFCEIPVSGVCGVCE